MNFQYESNRSTLNQEANLDHRLRISLSRLYLLTQHIRGSRLHNLDTDPFYRLLVRHLYQNHNGPNQGNRIIS